MSKMKKRFLFIFLVCLGLCAEVIMSSYVEKKEENPFDLTENSIEIESLKTPKTYSFGIVLEPAHLTTINSEITSHVLKINARMGDSFEKDEVLMELDESIFQGNFLKASAIAIRFKSELETKQRLYDDDALSRFELDEGVAALKGAEADLIFAKKALDSTKIRAPYKGRVVKVALKEFELAQLGKELITLVDEETLYAKFLASSDLIHCLKKGMVIDIYIKELGDKVKATITRMAPVIDPSSSTITVEAKVDDPKHKLLSGMTGRIDFRACEPKSNESLKTKNLK